MQLGLRSTSPIFKAGDPQPSNIMGMKMKNKEPKVFRIYINSYPQDLKNSKVIPNFIISSKIMANIWASKNGKKRKRGKLLFKF